MKNRLFMGCLHNSTVFSRTFFFHHYLIIRKNFKLKIKAKWLFYCIVSKVLWKLITSPKSQTIFSSNFSQFLSWNFHINKFVQHKKCRSQSFHHNFIYFSLPPTRSNELFWNAMFNRAPESEREWENNFMECSKTILKNIASILNNFTAVKKFTIRKKRPQFIGRHIWHNP